MARVTVKDCLKEIPDVFELVVLGAERAKHIASGAPITIPDNKNKRTVFALREIAAGTIDVNSLREGVVSKYQKNKKIDKIIEENLYAEAQEPSDGDESVSIDEPDYSYDDGGFSEETDSSLDVGFVDGSSE